MTRAIKRSTPKALKALIRRIARRNQFVRDVLVGLMPNPRQKFLLQMPKHSVCAEIGVHEGDYSAQILDVVQPRKLHLIDPWLYQPDPTYERAWYGGADDQGQANMDARFQRVQRRFSESIASSQVVVHRATSDVANPLFEEHYFDWIYIDGNHLYEFVKADLESYLPKMKPKGYILGDDYHQPGWWEDGVTRAVDEFVAVHQLKLEIIDHQFCIAL